MSNQLAALEKVCRTHLLYANTDTLDLQLCANSTYHHWSGSSRPLYWMADTQGYIKWNISMEPKCLMVCPQAHWVAAANSQVCTPVDIAFNLLGNEVVQ